MSDWRYGGPNRTPPDYALNEELNRKALVIVDMIFLVAKVVLRDEPDDDVLNEQLKELESKLGILRKGLSGG